MADVFDYLQWRGDLSFSQDPPNEVDALIFSGLSYIQHSGGVEANPYEAVPLTEAATAFFELPDYENRVRVKNDLVRQTLEG